MSRPTDDLNPLLILLAALMIASALGLGGCSTYRAYEGQARPPSEVAFLDVPRGQYVLDGTTLPRSNVNRIEMLPGWHDIGWTFEYPNRFEESVAMSFHAGAGGNYRLGERFFPAPHWAGPLGAMFEGVIGTALLPFTLLLPSEDADAPPEGEHFAWIVDRATDQLIAGSPPDVPAVHEAITFVPVD